MTVIDPSTDVGKLRLRCADHSDLPFLPDVVYTQALADASGNLPIAAKTCSLYILGILSQKTHRKLNQLECWGAEAFKNYRDYLLLTIKDPAFCSLAPLPYAATEEYNSIVDFQQNWNRAYSNGTESQSLARIADLSPNDNSRTGGYWGGY